MNPISSSNSNPLKQSFACWQQFIDKISHVFTNKLAVLRKKHLFLLKIIPSLLKGYHLAIEHKLMKPEIAQPLLENINTIIDLAEEVEPVFKILDSVTSFCSHLSGNTIDQSFSIKNCINDILSTYEFKNNNRNAIQFNNEVDFDCTVPEFFIKTTLTALLNFTFSNFTDLSEKTVHICLKDLNKSHTLQFKIVSAETQRNYDHWFQNSLDLSVSKVSPGINLCRLALLLHNGDIAYQAITGQSIEIMITMPNKSNLGVLSHQPYPVDRS